MLTYSNHFQCPRIFSLVESCEFLSPIYFLLDFYCHFEFCLRKTIRLHKTSILFHHLSESILKVNNMHERTSRSLSNDKFAFPYLIWWVSEFGVLIIQGSWICTASNHNKTKKVDILCEGLMKDLLNLFILHWQKKNWS